jgi:hypothetical protein
VSTSIGVTLCQQCSTVHRQLSWAISKLKSIELDEFSEWQVRPTTHHYHTYHLLYSTNSNPVMCDALCGLLLWWGVIDASCVVSSCRQMKILVHELGNDRVNAVWEMNIPAGWDKPIKVSWPSYHTPTVQGMRCLKQLNTTPHLLSMLICCEVSSIY